MTEVERKACVEAVYMADRVCYAYPLGFEPYGWQKAFLRDKASWKLLLCARQSGKSTVISLATSHKAKYWPDSLSVVLAPNRDQSQDDMAKIRAFIRHDPEFPELVKNNGDALVLDNGSRIQVVTATDTGARGKSAPALVIFDEAALIRDDVLGAALPMVTHSAPGYEVVYLSTPHGQSGGFYKAAIEADTGGQIAWRKYKVISPWIPDDDGMHLHRDSRTPEELMDECVAQGWAGGWFSPQHEDHAKQEKILRQIGTTLYLQEYRCEFVAADDDVFDPGDVDSLMDASGFDAGEVTGGLLPDDDDDFTWHGEEDGQVDPII